MILLYSAEAGGAQILTPIIQYLQTRGFHLNVLARRFASERFTLNGIQHETVEAIKRHDTTLLSLYYPQLLITSACSFPWDDMGEKHLWSLCRERQIPSLALLDDWQNYTIRFSGPSPQEHMAYRPDRLSCINSHIQQDLVDCGLPEATILAWGQPALEQDVDAILPLDKRALRQAYQFDPERTLELYVTQVLSRGIPYSQAEVMDYALRQMPQHAQVLVKLHPRDLGDELRAMVAQRHAGKDLRFVRQEISPAEAIALSDRVWGVSSIMLTVAYLVERPVVSIQLPWQPGFNVLLSKMGEFQTITDLSQRVNLARPAPKPRLNFRFHYQALERFVENTLKLCCV